MSDKEKPKNPTNKMKVVVMAILGIVVLAGAGIGTALVLNKKDTHAAAAKKSVKHDPKEDPAAEEEEEDDGSSGTANKLTFIPLDTFTINLSGEQFAQISLSLAVKDPKVAEGLKEQSPLLKDRILKTIAKKTAEQLLSDQGKKELSDEILEAVRQLVPKKERKNIKEVLFTSFIIQ